VQPPGAYVRVPRPLAAAAVAASLFACSSSGSSVDGGGSRGESGSLSLVTAIDASDAAAAEAGPALATACGTFASFHYVSTTSCTNCLANGLDGCNSLVDTGTGASCFASSCASVCDEAPSPDETCACLEQSCSPDCVAFERYYTCVETACEASCSN
jgi:hypothetical protein